MGGLLAGFFVAIFPGNVAQYLDGVDAFGLDTDRARLIRLFFQPLLVGWALWAGHVLPLADQRRTRPSSPTSTVTDPPSRDLARDQLPCERITDGGLDQTTQRTCTVRRVVAVRASHSLASR